MRAPAFWWRAGSPLGLLLAPAGRLVGAVAARRMRQSGETAPLPVICIGNLVAGGAGKTPTALAVAERLAARGERPVFLSRGYRGRLAGPLLVESRRHDPADVGDEPLLLARAFPTVVAKDRRAGARFAARHGSVVVMDDGFQNPALAKDLALVVVDGGQGIGNGRVLPAGPLRAPIEAQLARTDAIVLVGQGPGEAVADDARRHGIPALRARLVPDEARAESLAGRRVLAFCGIGRPQKFFDTLRALGADLAGTRSFPDHHPIGEAEAAQLVTEAAGLGAVLVTTEKDAVKLRGGPARQRLAAAATVLPVRLVFADQRLLDGLLEAALSARGPAA